MLSRSDIQLLWDVTNQCAEARSLGELRIILKGPLRSLFPHDCAAFGICRPSTDTVQTVVNIDFPSGFVARVARIGQTLDSPVAMRWKQEGRIVHFPRNHCMNTPQYAAWDELFSAYGLKSITAHGVIDRALDLCSYFSFGNLAAGLNEREATLLCILVPHLHNALIAVGEENVRQATAPDRAGGSADAARAGLSQRELEVLKWVQAGKTNYETGAILGISEFTVKNHMQRIMAKLNASNRAHAIAKAVNSGMLQMA